MTVETIIKLKVTSHDDELPDPNPVELAEFIVDVLENEFRKDFLEFEVVDLE